MRFSTRAQTAAVFATKVKKCAVVFVFFFFFFPFFRLRGLLWPFPVVGCRQPAYEPIAPWDCHQRISSFLVCGIACTVLRCGGRKEYARQRVARKAVTISGGTSPAGRPDLGPLPSVPGDKFETMTTTTTTTTTPMTSSVADSNDLAVPDSDEFRFVGLGAPVTEDDAARRDDLQKHFSSNSVRNTKYRWYSLVPKSLWNQFRRLANVYFLIMSVAMMVGNYTEAYDAPIEGINTLVTLLITMLVTMAIEAKDDCERAKKDREINGTETVRLHAGLDLLRMDAKHPAHRPWRPKHFRDPALGGEAIVQWKDVVVGDLVLVFKDETFPADVLLLASDAPDSSCFIETKSIDGETNLKKRRPAEGLAGLSGQHSAEAMASSPTKGAGAESRTGPYHVPSPCEAANAFLAGSGYLRCEHPNVHVDENPGELYLKIDNSKLKHSQAGTNMVRVRPSNETDIEQPWYAPNLLVIFALPLSPAYTA